MTVALGTVGIAAFAMGVGALVFLRGTGGVGKLTDGFGPKRKKGASRLSDNDELETADGDEDYHSEDADDAII